MESDLKNILKLCSNGGGIYGGGTPEMLPELLKGLGLQSDFERLHNELMGDYQCVNTALYFAQRSYRNFPPTYLEPHESQVADKILYNYANNKPIKLSIRGVNWLKYGSYVEITPQERKEMALCIARGFGFFVQTMAHLDLEIWYSPTEFVTVNKKA